MKKVDDNKLNHIAYFLIAVFSLIVLLLIFACKAPDFKDKVELACAAAGSFAAIIGVPYLIRNFILQRQSYEELKRQQIDAEQEHNFEQLCKSIEIGLSYVTNIKNDINGGPAIVKYGELNNKGTLSFDNVISELGLLSLKAVSASLSELINWIMVDSSRYKYYSFYRVRFVAIVQGLEQMMPENIFKFNKDQLFEEYGDDQEKYSFILAVWELHRKDCNLWIKIEEEQELVKRES